MGWLRLSNKYHKIIPITFIKTIRSLLGQTTTAHQPKQLLSHVFIIIKIGDAEPLSSLEHADCNLTYKNNQTIEIPDQTVQISNKQSQHLPSPAHQKNH